MTDKDKPNESSLGALIGWEDTDQFDLFNMEEIQRILSFLSSEAVDEAMALSLQQQSLHGADILSVYLARLTKTVSILEAKVTTAKNKASLMYKAPDGKTTADMKKSAGECDPAVEELQYRLGRAKGAKQAVASKYEILLKSHHHFKDIANQYRLTNKMVSPSPARAVGWE